MSYFSHDPQTERNIHSLTANEPRIMERQLKAITQNFDSTRREIINSSTVENPNLIKAVLCNLENSITQSVVMYHL